MFVLILSFLLGGLCRTTCTERARMALRECSLIKVGHRDSSFKSTFRISGKNTAGPPRCREGGKSYEEIEACSLSKDNRL